MTKKYYYFTTALPPLQVGYPPDISYEEFKILLNENLSPEHYQTVFILKLLTDIENIRAFWKKDELDVRGNYNEVQLEDALLTQEGLPDYVYQFILRYENMEERLQNFPALITAYFQNSTQLKDGFFKEYLQFERELRLVMVGFRAKKLGRDVTTELQFEDPYDDIVVQIMAQKDAKSFEPPSRYEDLKGLFEEHYHAPLTLNQAISEYRFYKIDDMLGVEAFSIDRILGYMIQLSIVEKWLELDKKKGLEFVDNIVKEAS